MESNHPYSREVLHEDLQILRYTLAAILDDVRRLSPRSADAVEKAIQDLDRARYDLENDDRNPSTEDWLFNLVPSQSKETEKYRADVAAAASRPIFFNQ